MGVEFDDSRWPVVVATFDGEQDPGSMEHYMRQMELYYERRQRFVTVYQIKGYDPADVKYAKLVGAWYMERKEDIEDLEGGLAMVIPSDTFRFILSSAMLIARVPKNYTVMKDLGEALDWASARVAEEPASSY